MTESLTQQHWSTIVVGGGQAGLATAHELERLGEEVVVLDAAARVGDAWRTRWDTLRLFTPAQYDGLPGLPFPAARGTFPTKDEMADYLERYAEQLRLPVLGGQRVEQLTRAGDRFELRGGFGALSADRVVVATGTNPRPRVPGFARELSPETLQLHSSGYLRAERLPAGPVLVVGAGTSGVEIALELSKAHRVTIAGRPTPHIPDSLLRYAGGAYWWFISTLLTIRTPIGRKARPRVVGGGAPLIRVSTRQLDRAGVERVGRVAGVLDGRPLLDDGRVLEVATVVWATGFQPEFSWIELPVTDATGWPIAPRGVSAVVEGLYFVGMPFQYGLTSGLVGGVGRDAAYVARHIQAARLAGERRSAAPRQELRAA